MQFYSYLWLREDGTPFYAGKGSGRRAYQSMRWHRPPKDRSRILIYPAGSEAEALASEIVMIDLFGRKDVGTGILRNRTDGGDGMSGYKFLHPHRHPQSAETRKKIGDAHRGMKASAETRLKLSLAKKGKTSSWKGKTASAETRLKQSLAAKNRPCLLAGWNKGRAVTLAQKQKQSAGLKKFWSTHDRAPISEETRQKMRIAKLGNRNRLGKSICPILISAQT